MNSTNDKYKSKFDAIIGIDESQNDIVVDWSRIYSALVSGTVASGKTNFVRNVLLSLLEQNPEENIKIAIFDSKGVDYSEYNNSGHLFWPTIITDMQELESVLSLVLAVVKDRLEKFKGNARDISLYNKEIEDENKRLPRVVVVIDGYEEVVNNPVLLNTLTDILKLNEGTGVHVILITSTITKRTVEPIKYLVNAFIAFAASTTAYSQLAIGMKGAEKLKYPGGMIFRNLNDIIQGETVLINNYKERIPAKVKEYIPDVGQNIIEDLGDTEPNDEVMLHEAIELVVDTGKASVSMLQRRFRIGYNSAFRLINKMEELGIVGPQIGSSPRLVLKTREDLGTDRVLQYLNDRPSDFDTSNKPLRKKAIDLNFSDMGGNNRFHYKFYAEDVIRVVFHKKKLFKKPYLEIELISMPLIAENNYIPIEKQHNIVSPYLNSAKEEQKMLDIGYGIASDAHIDVEFE